MTLPRAQGRGTAAAPHTAHPTTESILRASSSTRVARARRSWSDVAFTVWGVLVMLFLFAPIIVIVVYSFNTGRLLVSWDGFGLDAFRTILDKPAIQSAVRCRW